MSTDYLNQIRKEFSSIRPGEEDDFEWWNQGLALLRQGKLSDAEKKFKMLAVSQPEHPDGFEGLARVYTKMKRKSEASYFIDAAIQRAKKFIKSGDMDPEALEMFEELRETIHKLADG